MSLSRLFSLFLLLAVSASSARGEESRHWAYRKPVRPAVPLVKKADWPLGDLDRFVLGKMEAAGLTPSPAADRVTLIRRVSLDLTGLPPTPAEVDAFLADSDPKAYERLVDRLLASPQFGEHWARLWLDLARYADTHGYERDMPRSMWPYRDWVIGALNRDMPFDQFTIEQLAGDLLPGATLAQRVATGFHRNTMLNAEAGVDDEEFRIAAVVDRVNTTTAVWLGTTLSCCQCHDHKYDPFTQREYYQLFAFFNSTADGGQLDGPQVEVPAAPDGPWADEIARLEQKLQTSTPEITAEQIKWEAELQALEDQWTPLADVDFSATSGNKAKPQADGSLLITGEAAEQDVYMLTGTTNLEGITAIRLLALPDDSLPARGPGRAKTGNFVLSEMTVAVAVDGQEPKRVEFGGPTADHAQVGWSAASATDGVAETGWGVGPQFGRRHDLNAETKEELTLPKGAKLAIKLDQLYGHQHTLGRVRIDVTKAPRPLKRMSVPAAIQDILLKPVCTRTMSDEAALAAHYRTLMPQLQPTRDRLAQIRSGKSLVMRELDQRRQTHILERGNFLTLGEQVQPGVPEVLPHLPAESSGNRLALARWIVSADNPLTARVLVNRIWERYFGRGIVSTLEDFGTRGDEPTHPELLDHLATELVAQGWHLKALHKQIVMSATYQQASKMTPELRDRDPDNRWLARASQLRLDGETIRDQALAASGLLSLRLGGPSVMPVQPAGIWMQPNSEQLWETSPGDDRHRRGLYTFWRRTSPYPTLVTFDAPSREFCVIRRPKTNTPLQALTMLNDPAMVEAAQALGRKLCEFKSNSSDQPGAELIADEARVELGFRLCVARQPEPAERSRLLKLFHDEQSYYRSDPQAARELVGRGVENTETESLANLAAWTVVANVLLNLDEMLTRS